jgi:hypothetical protein
MDSINFNTKVNTKMVAIDKTDIVKSNILFHFIFNIINETMNIPLPQFRTTLGTSI